MGEGDTCGEWLPRAARNAESWPLAGRLPAMAPCHTRGPLLQTCPYHSLRRSIRTLDRALPGQPAQPVLAARRLTVAKVLGSTAYSRSLLAVRLHAVLTRSQPGTLTGDHGRTDHRGDEALGWLDAFARWESLQRPRGIHAMPNSPRGASPTKESLMSEHPDTGSLFAHCIALNREAFAAELVASFHACQHCSSWP
jgi:hypothetical protein